MPFFPARKAHFLIVKMICNSLIFQEKQKSLTSFCNMLYASELGANPYGFFVKLDLSEKIGDFAKKLWMRTYSARPAKNDGSVPA